MMLDFASGGDFVRAFLPEIVLSAWAMAVLLAGVWGSDEDRESPEYVRSLGWLAFAGILAAGVLNAWLTGLSGGDALGIVALDGFRTFANWIFLIGGGMAILVSLPYVTRQRLQAGEFYALVLLATVGMMVMAGTRNLILLFLALEMMSIASYVLTGFNRRDRRSAEAGLKYFILGAFSSGFLLYGIALVWGATGSVDLVQIAATIEAGAGFTGLLLAGMGLLAIGFAFKVAAVPFHMWTPDVYEGAPSPSTALMAASVKAASVIAFVRVFLVAFPALHTSWYPVFWWLAVLTMVIGNLIALSQGNVKRMLAYSSVAHGGYLLVGLTAGNETATGAILFYLLVYTVMTVGIFGVVMIVAKQGEERLEIEEYAGLGTAHPLLGVLLTVFLLSLAGFPGTGGFMAKIYLLQGAVESRLWTLAVVLALATVVSYYYYLRLAWYAWMRPERSRGEWDGLASPTVLRTTLAVAAVVLLLLGILPGTVLDAALAAAEGVSLPVGAQALLGRAP